MTEITRDGAIAPHRGAERAGDPLTLFVDVALPDREWDELYRLHGPQRPYAARPGLAAKAPTGEIEYASGTTLRLADLFPPRPNWRESTDGTLRQSMRQRPQNAPGREEGAE